MLKVCKKCGKIGLWFQFYSSCQGLYQWTPNICKECLQHKFDEAVTKELEKLEPPSPIKEDLTDK
jgi:hypothetical protein